MQKFAAKYSTGMEGKNLLDLFASKLDLQTKNQFECLIVNQISPFSGDSLASTAGNIAVSTGASMVDTAMAKLFLYSITIPSYGYEYRKIEGNAFVTNSVYPEMVTMSFLEDAYGITRRWIQYWMSQVAIPYEFNYDVDSYSNVTYFGRIYKENQKAAKKNATILMRGPKGIPYYPRIMLYGLRPQTVEEVLIGEEEQDKLMLNLTCSIDEIKIPWLV